MKFDLPEFKEKSEKICYLEFLPLPYKVTLIGKNKDGNIQQEILDLEDGVIILRKLDPEKALALGLITRIDREDNCFLELKREK